MPAHGCEIRTSEECGALRSQEINFMGGGREAKNSARNLAAQRPHRRRANRRDENRRLGVCPCSLEWRRGSWARRMPKPRILDAPAGKAGNWSMLDGRRTDLARRKSGKWARLPLKLEARAPGAGIDRRPGLSPAAAAGRRSRRTFGRERIECHPGK